MKTIDATTVCPSRAVTRLKLNAPTRPQLRAPTITRIAAKASTAFTGHSFLKNDSRRSRRATRPDEQISPRSNKPSKRANQSNLSTGYGGGPDAVKGNLPNLPNCVRVLLVAAGNELLTPKDLAAAIGASESSLRRWIDSGDIRVSRTAGGHRRIPLGEAVQFIRKIGAVIVRPEVLNMPPAPILGDTASVDEGRLFAALREGR